jgi:hypothetical protein
MLALVFFFVINLAADDNLSTTIDSSATKSIEKENLSANLKIPQNPQADSSIVPTVSISKQMFARLGELHRLRGIYGVVTGTLGILAGVILLDKADSAPFAMSFISLGGISISLGIWEIKIGRSLLSGEALLK